MPPLAAFAARRHGRQPHDVDRVGHAANAGPLVLEATLRNALAEAAPDLMGNASNSLSNSVTWKTKLKPGEKFEPGVTYHYFTRHKGDDKRVGGAAAARRIDRGGFWLI